jgi:hypothetical protein
LKTKGRGFSFAQTHRSLADVLKDHELASLGDAYINFAYSLALSSRKGRPVGVKVKGETLADALKKTGLREYAPSRMTRHTLADAAEALIVYAWLQGYLTLEETVSTLEKADDLVQGLSKLLLTMAKKIKFS